jgi:MiaB-like tRNA modifying enzyme
MRKFYTATLGCKINQYETRSVSEAWSASGALEVQDEAEADVILVNSCAVTANAVADLRRLVRRLHRDNPQAEIIVTGCAAQVAADEVAELPGVQRLVPHKDKAVLLEGLDSVGHVSSEKVFPAFSVSGYGRSRAVVKVQDGCSHRCTYCIVPLARGASVSRPTGAVLDEIRRLLDAGFREMVLSGVNLRQFGRDLPGKPDFWDLLGEIEARFGHEWKGRARLRISSLEPGQLGEKALAVLADSSLVAPQLHLSLQSGDPEVLRRMGRGHYRPEQALEFLERLRDVWPVFGLGADLLTGFPGETGAEFENGLEFCRKLPLSYAHVFPFSPRPDTPAAEMDGQLPGDVKKDRAKRLREVAAKGKADFLKKLLRLPELSVLVQDGEGRGVSEYYASCRIENPSSSASPKRLVRCAPVRVEDGVIICKES